MQRDLRLAGEKQFDAVHQQGRSWANQLLVLKALPNGLDSSRFGFSVSKRVGGAVARNRLKRLLREGVRLSQVKSGWDAIIIVRRGATTADFHQLKWAIDNLLERAGLLESPTLKNSSQA